MMSKRKSVADDCAHTAAVYRSVHLSGAQAQAIKESYAFAVLGEPRYAFNFNHFDYVNPAAPKGGR